MIPMKKLFIASSMLVLCLAQSGYATDITVTTTADAINGNTTSISALTGSPGPDGISLREAIIAANNDPTGAPHRILIPAGTYQLSIDGTGENYPADPAVGDLDITRSGTTIEGISAAATIIQQTRPNDRVLEVNPNLDASFLFTVKNVTMRGGRETTGIGGGAMISGSGLNQTIVTGCLFTDNFASGFGSPIGGAIANAGGNLTVSNCTFNGNGSSGGGGAIAFDASTSGGTGILTLSSSQFTNNISTSGNGGAIETTGLGTTYSISGCSFIGNQITGLNTRGGAIYNQSGTLTIALSTFQNNQATSPTGAGGAIGSADGSGHNVTVSYCRFLGNTAATAANGLTLRGGTSSTLTANDNWWGINTGPAANQMVNATATLWLQMTHSASPATIADGVGGTTTLTASFLTDSGANTISPANLAALVGVPITFGSAVHGTLSSAQTTIQSSGTATATFTATAPGSASAVAIVDAQSKTANISVVPTVNSVDVPPDALYGVGQALDFTVTFNEAIVVAGATPYLPVTLSTGGTVQAAYLSGSGSTALTFRYVVAAGNGDNDGIALAGALVLNGATLRDSSAINANLTLNGMAGTSGILVDGVAPTIVISAPSPTVTTGGSVDFTVTYADANFDVSTLAVGDITLNSPGTAGGTITVSGSGLTRTVSISNITGHGPLGISIAAGTAIDLAGNTAPAAGPSATATVNLPPTIAGTLSGQAVNDNATLSPFVGVTIANSDVPAQTLDTTITLDNAAKGAFTPASLTGSGFTLAGPGAYTFNGTAADATTAIRLLVFAPTSNRVTRGSTETTTFTINVTDGVFTPVVNSATTVVTTSVNHAPTAVADAIQRFATQGVKVATTALLANDTDPDSDALTITAVFPTSANGASIYLADTWVHYVPAAGFTSSDTFTYTISDGHGGTAEGTVTVNIKTDDSTGSNQIGSIQNLGSGVYRITFGGIPGRSYTIQYTTSLIHPIDWQTLGTSIAGPSGTIIYDDNSGSPLRFYRTVYP